jgi:hypothetical protein
MMSRFDKGLVTASPVAWALLALLLTGETGAAQEIGTASTDSVATIPPEWKLSTQLYSTRGVATTTLSILGTQRSTSAVALLELICYAGTDLEVSMVSPDSLAENDRNLRTDVWARRNGAPHLELEAMLISPYRLVVDYESSRQLVNELMVDSDTFDILVFRGDGRPFRAVFPLGQAPPGVSVASFCN